MAAHAADTEEASAQHIGGGATLAANCTLAPEPALVEQGVEAVGRIFDNRLYHVSGAGPVE